MPGLLVVRSLREGKTSVRPSEAGKKTTPPNVETATGPPNGGNIDPYLGKVGNRRQASQREVTITSPGIHAGVRYPTFPGVAKRLHEVTLATPRCGFAFLFNL